MTTLTVNAQDINCFPDFDTEGWGWQRGQSITSVCFAWVLNDPHIGGAIPGKGDERIRQRTMYESLAGPGIRFTEPVKAPELNYGEGPKAKRLAEYAVKQWQNMVERDGMTPITPDENGMLNIPAGTYPVFLAVKIKENGELGRHWYRADRPSDPSKPVTWSHWDGEQAPTSFAGMGNITDPWRQCAFEKYSPVGYFLITAQKPDGPAQNATMRPAPATMANGL